jgi:flavodoxin
VGIQIKIELYHASKYGNGARVAEEIKRVMELKGHQVNVHHIDDAEPKDLPPADMYIFGSPTRMNGPIKSMLKFVKKASLKPGTRFAVFATHADQVPDKRTGQVPTEQELDRKRRTIPDLDELLQGRGMTKVDAKVFHVTADVMKGSLKEGWERRVEEFTAALLTSM